MASARPTTPGPAATPGERIERLITVGRLSEEQLALVAGCTTARLRSIRRGRGGQLTPRERKLVEQDVNYVRDVVEQMEGVGFLIEHGVRRSDLARAVDTSVASVRFWCPPTAEEAVMRVDGEKRKRLLGVVARARRAVERGKKLTDAETLKEVLQIPDVRSRHAGRRPDEEIVELEKKMREGGLLPARTRAATMKALVALGEARGVTKEALMQRLNVSRELFYKMLDPAQKLVLPADVIEAVATERGGLEKQPTLEERFVAAMRTILGPEVVESGFAEGGDERVKALQRLNKLTGIGDRQLRRMVPPYPTGWRKARGLHPVFDARSLAMVQKFESAAEKAAEAERKRSSRQPGGNKAASKKVVAAATKSAKKAAAGKKVVAAGKRPSKGTAKKSGRGASSARPRRRVS